MASEFSELTDLAISTGIKHSDITAAVSEAVLAKYQLLYPDEKQDVTVLIDEQTGTIRLMSEKKDITPPTFEAKASQIARQTTIVLMKQGKAKQGGNFGSLRLGGTDTNLGKWLTQLFFWSYNGIYIVTVTLIALTLLLNKIFRENLITEISQVGAFRTVILTCMILIPFISVVIALKLNRKGIHNNLGRLFFFFEVPLLIMLSLLSSAFEKPSFAMWFVISIVLLSIPVTFFYLLKLGTQNRYWRVVSFLASEAVALTAGYFALLYSFFVPVVVGSLLKQFVAGLFDGYWFRNTSFSGTEMLMLLLLLGLAALAIFSIGLLLVFPYFSSYLFALIFRRNWLELKQSIGDSKTFKLSVSWSVLLIALLFVLSYQPGIASYITKLESLGKATTFEEKKTIAKELLPHEFLIKKAFEDLKDVHKKYLFTKDDDFLAEAYQQTFYFSPLPAQLIQETFSTLAYPFVYQGEVSSQYAALNAYQYLFGTDSLTTKPTKQINQVSLLTRKVDANATEDKLLASITVEEEYENTGFGNQEIIYEFSFPIETVVTNLKLGEKLEYEGQVAPKGAARKVYEQELRQSQDPALLEQTGPTQYRLRVFPIPSKGKQKIQFTYITGLTQKGYPLPVYTKIHNLSDNAAYKSYTLNGIQLSAESGYLYDPQALIKVNQLCSAGSSSLAQVGTITATITPSCTDNAVSNAKNLNLAVLIDVSHTNKYNVSVEALNKLLANNQNFLTNNNIDLFFFNDVLSTPTTITPDTLSTTFSEIIYFGKGDWENAIAKLNGNYDAAVILISSNDNVLLKEGSSLRKSFPIYLVYENGAPSYNTKATAQILQSKGVVANNFEDAINLFWKTRSKSENSVFLLSHPFAILTATPKSTFEESAFSWVTPDPYSPTNSLSSIAAYGYFKHKLTSLPASTDTDISFLDQSNNFAQASKIVTPYSSLVALVNQRQISNLERESYNYDRYQDSTAPTTAGSPFRFEPRNAELPNPFGMGIQSLNLDSTAPGVTGGITLDSVSSYGTFGITNKINLFGNIGLILIANAFILVVGTLVFVVSKLIKTRLHKS